MTIFNLSRFLRLSLSLKHVNEVCSDWLPCTEPHSENTCCKPRTVRARALGGGNYRSTQCSHTGVWCISYMLFPSASICWSETSQLTFRKGSSTLFWAFRSCLVQLGSVYTLLLMELCVTEDSHHLSHSRLGSQVLFRGSFEETEPELGRRFYHTLLKMVL